MSKQKSLETRLTRRVGISNLCPKPEKSGCRARKNGGFHGNTHLIDSSLIADAKPDLLCFTPHSGGFAGNPRFVLIQSYIWAKRLCWFSV